LSQNSLQIIYIERERERGEREERESDKNIKIDKILAK
jgi:hypothetical protein